MLQLKKLSALAHEKMASQTAFPPKWDDMAELEAVVDRWVGRWPKSASYP